MNILWRLPKHTKIIENPISRRYITGTHHGKYIDYEMSEQNKTETVYSIDKSKPKKTGKKIYMRKISREMKQKHDKQSQKL